MKYGPSHSVVFTALVLALAAAAPRVAADVLYFEDFEDTELAPDTTTQFATIAGGIGTFDDMSTTTRARFVVRRGLASENPTFTAPVMTFSFDTVAPVTNVPGSDMELLLRAGIGTGDNTLSSTEFILEAILFRTGSGGTTGGPRDPFLNNGNETLFVVANNKETQLVFPSPVDGADVTLEGFQYVRYVRNNDTNTFAQLAGIANFTDRNADEPGPGDIIRLGIGTSSNGHQGTFAIDNVAVFDEVNFIGVPEPPVVLTLGVDPATGQVVIRNDNPEPIAFSSYRITSASGSLNPSGWDPIATGTPIPGFPQGNGTGNGWEAPGGDGNPPGDFNSDGKVDAADYVVWRKTGGSQLLYDTWRANFGATGGGIGGDNTELVEWYLTGESTLAAGASLGLGQAFNTGGTQDLVFQFATGNSVRTGVVQYGAIGSGAASAVPEPSTLCVAALVFGLLSATRSRIRPPN